FFQAEDGIRDRNVTGVQTCALPIYNVGTLHDKLSEVGSNLLLETLPPLFAGNLTPIKQEDSQATFAANIRREQEKIDWSKSNVDVYNQIRGLNPWPVAYTTFESKNMKIWKAELYNNEYKGEPREIIKKIKDKGFVVICGNNKGVLITEIQPAGNKRLTVREYLLGSEERIKLGGKMGE